LIDISSKRLKLIPLDHYLLSIWKEKGREELERILKLGNNKHSVGSLAHSETEEALTNFWLPQTAQYPDNFFWFTNWEIILSSQNISIGGIGFAGYPDDGKTTIGYIIDQKYQNQGFAKEAVNCIIDWAFMDPALKAILADTPKDNLPSQKVLSRNGFLITGESSLQQPKALEVYHWSKNNPNF
jgi:[ribosomal protein S5]-alanine N-acetyltransferase